MYHIHEVKKTIKEVIKEMIFIIDGKSEILSIFGYFESK